MQYYFSLLSLVFIFSVCEIEGVHAAGESEISYRNGSIYFSTSKSVSKLSFKDRLGARELEIKDCNRDLVESFWKEITDSVASLKSSKMKRIPAGSATLKFEGVQFPVLVFEPARQYFNRLPEKAHALFLESFKKCTK